jgi:hypothetical protein
VTTDTISRGKQFDGLAKTVEELAKTFEEFIN